jgi:hypothetical protein
VLRRRGLSVVPLSVVLALVGAAFGVEEFVLLAVAGVSLLGVGGLTLCWQVRRVRRALHLEVDRAGGELFVGDDAAVTLVGVNRGRHTLPALWVAGGERWAVSHPGLTSTGVVPPPIPGDSFEAAPGWARRLRGWLGAPIQAGTWRPVPALAPAEHWRLSIPVSTRSRGLWSLGPVALWCTDPLGLTAWPVGAAPVSRMVVFPVPLALDPADLPTGEGAPARPSAGFEGPPAWTAGGDEFGGLRPYVPGDRLTRLHWPALARSGQLLSRHFVEHQDPLELLIDTRPWKIDAAAAGAAGIGTVALSEGRPVTLSTGAGERLVVAPGPLGRAQLLRALALVGPRQGTLR